MKTSMTLAIAALTALGAAATVPAKAGDVQGDAYGCDELWTMRNEIFKAGGYCFKSPRAIKQFGNAGCQHDDEFDVPLSGRDRETLSAIKKSECRQSCSRARAARALSSRAPT